MAQWFVDNIGGGGGSLGGAATARAHPDGYTILLEQFLIESGFEPDVDSSSEEFRGSLEGDIARWTPVVNALGLKID